MKESPTSSYVSIDILNKGSFLLFLNLENVPSRLNHPVSSANQKVLLKFS